MKIEFRRIDYGPISENKIIIDTVTIHNPTKEEMKFSIPDAPKHIEFNFTEKILAPSEKTKLITTYKTQLINDYGLKVNNVKINTENSNGKKTGTLTITATIEEDFSDLTDEEWENAPMIQIVEKNLNFTDVEVDKPQTKILHFTNNGKRDLIIRKIKSKRKEFEIVSFDKIVKPGESGEIEVVLNLTYQINKVQSLLSIFSNDPKNSTKNLYLNAEMEFREKKIKTKNDNKPTLTYSNISLGDAYEMIKTRDNDDNFIILDVRTKPELEVGYIQNSILYEYESPDFRKFLTILDKSRTYLVYAKTGYRSMEAMKIMKEMKFQNVFNLEEGFNGWKKGGYPFKTDQKKL